MKGRDRAAATAFVVLFVALALVAGSACAADKKPNILFIMADDIGWMQPSI
jgi:ABC-type sugar transport system substrate-binding protein